MALPSPFLGSLREGMTLMRALDSSGAQQRVRARDWAFAG